MRTTYRLYSPTARAIFKRAYNARTHSVRLMQKKERYSVPFSVYLLAKNTILLYNRLKRYTHV
jgi:hypothetical protein